MGIQRLFRKAGLGAQRFFSKVAGNPISFLNKATGSIATPMSAGGNIVGGLGVLTAQPELVALGGGMKAVGAVAGGVNTLTKNSNNNNKNNSLQRSVPPLPSPQYGPNTGFVGPNYAN